MPAMPVVHNTDSDEAFRTSKDHRLHIRPLTHDDREALDTFVESLSPRSRRLRFFSAIKHLDPALLEHFVDLNSHDRVAFAATLDERPGICAVGRYEAEGPGSAEVAFAVADELQGEGIGTELLHHLVAHARKEGITEFKAYVLFENQRMFDVFRHSGYPMSAECGDGVSIVTLSLAEGARDE